ncbi:MAG: hypothetical protein HHJ16_13535 [Polaromonas sp.]|uniref:hypothetical protein n=1 Tax=Polaromonas sp. TaxID=1869339 RepID=UPI0017BC3A71|nr:hypothetical protein [Polaromonas sp.]NMM11278.1 hypothetical protein [Polaromonas sp.]
MNEPLPPSSPLCAIKAASLPFFRRFLDSGGVLIAAPDRLQVARYVPQRSMPNLPFALWMAQAKTASLNSTTSFSIDGPARSLLLGNEEYLDGGQAAAGTGA